MATQSSTSTNPFGSCFSPLLGQPRMGLVPMPNVTVATVSTAGAVTYTAAQLLGGFLLRDPNGAGRSDVTPTALQLVQAIPAAQAAVADTAGANQNISASFEFDIRNTADANETITVTAGTGVTLSGTMTIAQNNGKRFKAVVTDATNQAGTAAVTIYSMGTYTF